MVMKRWWMCLFVASLYLLPAYGRCADWERFRGPEGAGQVTDTNAPLTWTTDENILWKAPLPGVGHSSPIISQGKVFVQSASADGSSRWLLCFDAATGRQQWKKEAPASHARTHPRNSMASSTPAADGKQVYAIYWNGPDIVLCCYDFQGNPVWNRNLGGFKSQHGPGLSPIVEDGRLFLANDQDGRSHLLALDCTTGKTLWEVERKAFRTCYSTPFLHTWPNHPRELIVASTAGITSYEPATGKELWSYTWTFNRKPLRTVASPIVAGDLVIASSGDGDGDRHLIAVRHPGTGQEDRAVLAWEKLRGTPYVPCMLSHQGHLYGVTDQGVAICFHAGTGEELWNKRLGSAFSASPIMVGGRIYAPAEDGRAYVFAAAPHFKLLATNDLQEPIIASPAAARGCLFFRGKKDLICVGKKGQPGSSSR